MYTTHGLTFSQAVHDVVDTFLEIGPGGREVRVRGGHRRIRRRHSCVVWVARTSGGEVREGASPGCENKYLKEGWRPPLPRGQAGRQTRRTLIPRNLKDNIYIFLASFMTHLSHFHALVDACYPAPQIGPSLTLAHLPHLESSIGNHLRKLWLRWEITDRLDKVLI